MRLTIACCILGLAPLAAADLAGEWDITAHAPNRDMKLSLVLKEAGGKWTGSLSSERGSVELEEISVSGGELSSKFTVGSVSYTLKLSAGGGVLKGSASSGDGVTVAVEGVRAGATAAGVAGKWRMKAATARREYDVELEITESEGALGGRIRTSEGDVVPIRDVKLSGGKLEFKIVVDPDVYEIQFEAGGSSMKGTYKLADGTTGPVTATR